MDMQGKLKELIGKFAGQRIAIFGDLMLDEYVFGSSTRISPEAPVPVVLAEQHTDIPGGAANVAANISALGGIPLLCGVIGEDLAGQRLEQALAERGIEHHYLVRLPKRKTTHKTRVMAQHQQIVRIDVETPEELDKAELEQIEANLREVLSQAQVVVISDYDKGAISDGSIRLIKKLIPKSSPSIIVDPKYRHYSSYKGCKLITPNHKEAGFAVGQVIHTEDDLRRVGTKLLQMVGCDAVLITWGERGMALFDGSGPFVHLPTLAREVFDVTGAGDTVIAALALAISAQAGLLEAAYLANYSAGIVVGKIGTSTVSSQELSQAISGLADRNGR
jgi:rfaE bifunctional protein kinase chain/domain